MSIGERVYVAAAQDRRPVVGDVVGAWSRGRYASRTRLTLRAVVAAPLGGLAGAAAARAEVDRVFDSADRHPGAIGQITSLDEAHTTVLLDEIVSQVAQRPRLVDPRVRQLRERGSDPGRNAEGLSGRLRRRRPPSRKHLHVHPNTVRYRVRRIEKLMSTSLDDPDVRLVLALGLRATEP